MIPRRRGGAEAQRKDKKKDRLPQSLRSFAMTGVLRRRGKIKKRRKRVVPPLAEFLFLDLLDVVIPAFAGMLVIFF